MAELLVLRLLHVLGGVFWVGTAAFNALFLLPAMATAGPAGGQVMAGLQRRRLMVVLPVVSLVTLLSGARLMWITSGGFGAGYFATTTGATFAWAAASATLAFVLGVAFVRPAMSRVGTLAPTLAATPEGPERARLADEMARLRRRAGVVNQVVLVMLVAAASGMAVARYLR
jgi:uncharacterized membrane protein